MSFEKGPISSKEGFTEAFKAFAARIEASENEVSELKQSIWSDRDLTQNEKVELLMQLRAAELLLVQQDNYVQKAA